MTETSVHVAKSGAANVATLADPRRPFLCWLLARPDTVAELTGLPTPLELQRVLHKLDLVITSDSARAHLLPRASHVVPQLMKTMRDESYSSTDVAQRISKDVVLTAEVIRSASSAYHRANKGGIDLARAVAMIGTEGLRRAIASVVLRPIFDARGDTPAAHAAPQIWTDADKKARLCAMLAAEQALDPFDGYLAGLLHNTGWSALLRAIDGLQDPLLNSTWLTQPQVALELFGRRDTLFGALVGLWELSPAVTQLAAEVGQGGLAAARSPLGVALRLSDQLAMRHALAPAGRAPRDGVPEWSALPPSVQQCYTDLAHA